MDSLITLLIIIAILRAAFGARSALPREPIDRRSEVEKRADAIDELLERGALDRAVSQGRMWIRDIDADRVICESVAAGSLASILEALVKRLPERLQEASSYGEALVSILDSKPSGGTAAKLRTLSAMAVVSEASDDAPATRKWLQAAVALSDSTDNVHPGDRVFFLFRLASACRASGAAEEAAREIERALVLQESLPVGSYDPSLRLEVFMLAGAVRFERGQIEDARTVLQRARDAAAETAALEDRFWLAAGMYWGLILLEQNDAAAVAALARTAEMEERKLGPDSSAPISTLFHLARAHLSQGSLPDAAAAFERALAIHDRTDGRHSAARREIVLGLSQIRFGLKEYDEARRLVAKLIEAEEQLEPRNDTEIATDLVQLATICRALADTRAEREHLMRALAAAERADGPESATLIPILERLGFVVWNSTDWADAREVNKRLASIQRTHLGSDHPLLASTLFNLALVTARCGDHDAARGLMTETMSILEATPFRPPDAAHKIVSHLEDLQRHPVHGPGYRDLLPRARALRADGRGGLPVAQA